MWKLLPIASAAARSWATTSSHARSAAASTLGSNSPLGTQVIVAQIECRVAHLQGFGYIGICRHHVCTKGFERDLLTRRELVDDLLQGSLWPQVKIDRLATVRLDDQVHAFERAPRGSFAGADFDVLDGSRHGLDRWLLGLSSDAGRLAHSFLGRRRHCEHQPQQERHGTELKACYRHFHFPSP